MYIKFCRLEVATKFLQDKRPVRIMERSIFSERFCFLESMNKKHGGPLSDPEYFLMDRWFHFASKQFTEFVRPDVIGK